MVCTERNARQIFSSICNVIFERFQQRMLKRVCVCVCVCLFVNLCSYKILLIRIHLEENMDVNGISNYVIRGHYLHVTLLPLSFTAQ
jgi:hypothetical protein